MATDNCSECCEDLQCEVDAIKHNVDQLFTRTANIKDFLETLLESHLFTIVNSEYELTEALSQGGLIAIGGDIDLTVPAIIGIDHTWLFAIPTSDGTKPRLRLPYQLGFNQAVIEVAADDVVICNLGITTGNPLTETNTVDHGIWISDAIDASVNRLRVFFCDIYNVALCITRSGYSFQTDTPVARDIKIHENRLRDFTHGGIFLSANTPGVSIVGNTIRGRDVSVAHATIWNGIWVGNNANQAFISRNIINKIGRHGIEYWNSQTDPLTVDGNDMAIIDRNIVFGLLRLSIPSVGSFCISAFGKTALQISNNICYDASIGIELYNTVVSKGRLNVINNHIENIDGQGISVNFVRNAHIADNYIKDISSDHGLQIINGCLDTEIVDNKFEDAGKWNIYVNSLVSLVSGVEIANDGWITLTAAMDAGRWAPEKEIWFFDLGGSVELNDLFFRATEFDIPNKKFRIGYDLSGVTPFTAGGSVRESYRRLKIAGNVFTFKDPATNAAARALYLPDVQDCLINNNTSFVLDSLAAGVGTFKVLNAAARVHNGTTTVTSLPGGGETDIAGTNIRMEWAAPLT